MRETRELLFFFNAMTEPRGSEPTLAGDLLAFVNEGWTAFADMRMVNSEAFDRAAPALTRRAADRFSAFSGSERFSRRRQFL